MTITETLKKKIDELEIEKHVQTFAAEAEKLVHRGLAAAGDLAHERGAEIEGFLDKATAKVDERTDGKYADQVGKVAGQLKTGVSRLAQRRNGAETDV
ncbi:MAG: antitoxin [Nocardioides sp.]|jgi:hypothetical protein